MPELTATTSKEQLYRDLSLTFARNPVTHDVAIVTGPDAVKRSLRFLLLSNAGETPFYPNFGTRLNALLFEPIDVITTLLIRDEILTTIAAYEPRVRVTELDVIPDEEQNRYQINMTFTILTQSQPITLSLFLTRLR